MEQFTTMAFSSYCHPQCFNPRLKGMVRTELLGMEWIILQHVVTLAPDRND